MKTTNDLSLDYFTIVVKKEKKVEIVNRYKCFGWTVFSEQQHFQYKNLFEIKFFRKHKIKNKDMLQFLQVNMEIFTINQGKLEKNKHKKSIIFSTILGLIGSFCLINTIYLLLNLSPVLNYILSAIFFIFSIFFAIFTPLITKKILENENNTYDKKNKEINSMIDYYCNHAKNNLEVENE